MLFEEVYFQAFHFELFVMQKNGVRSFLDIANFKGNGKTNLIILRRLQTFN